MKVKCDTMLLTMMKTLMTVDFLRRTIIPTKCVEA
jgi:hypothetical protein